MISLAVFVFGLAIGSFLNAFIYRLELREGLVRSPSSHKPSVLHGRSFCPHCGHTLVLQDLIPLLSFLFLRGRCRYCKKRISFQYPIVELATALLFVAIFIYFVDGRLQNILYLGYLWFIASSLIVIFVYDLKHCIILDKILYPAISLAFLWRVFEFLGFGISAPLVQSLLAGISAAVFFLAIFLISRGAAMGFGDVKLAFLLGMFLGWPSILVALFFAFCLGAVVGVVLITLKKKGLKSEVPFAPFLIIGTAIAFFFGSDILSWYLGLFLV